MVGQVVIVGVIVIVAIVIAIVIVAIAINPQVVLTISELGGSFGLDTGALEVVVGVAIGPKEFIMVEAYAEPSILLLRQVLATVYS